MTVHLFSPLLYAGFVYCVQDFKKIEAPWFYQVRKVYNVCMSLLSAYMLYIVTLATYQDSKFMDWSTPYQSYTGEHLCMYSKYVEWLDTLFLVLSGKPISRLQYIHHMTTVMIAYTNIGIPSLFVFMGSNCFVHVFMYWYFAFPRGTLKPYRRWITFFQIVQHMACIYTSIYMVVVLNYRSIGLYIGFGMYAAFFTMFSNFYLQNYCSKK